MVMGLGGLSTLASGVGYRWPHVMDGRQLGRRAQPEWACWLLCARLEDLVTFPR